jgi:predicted lipid-binding transport protein (Tim44 family)
MHKILTVLTLVMTTAVLGMLPVQDAEAKRFGFGKSFGNQSTWSRQKTTPKSSTTTSKQQTTQNGTAAAGARTSGASRWLGPLAGLAAGGLLAAMLFGDGFEGLQILDILIFALLIFGGMALFRAMRAKSGPQMAGAGGFGSQQFHTETPMVGDAQFSEEVDAQQAIMETPAWFNGHDFAEGAKTHFIRLQAAWDKNDLKDIAEYTTPELYAELQNERLNRGEERHFTEVVTLNTELVEVKRENDQVVASVLFSGLIREEQSGEATEFSELWHVVHPWDNAEGDWKIAGIQQVE